MRTRTTGARVGATAFAMALAASGITACGSTEAPAAPQAHLEITSSDSSKVVTVDATEGAEATLKSPYADDGAVDIEVESVDVDEVELGTSEDMAPEGDAGGINLNDLQSRFTATKGEDVTFSTPTMDAGTTWTVTVEDGPAPS